VTVLKCNEIIKVNEMDKQLKSDDEFFLDIKIHAVRSTARFKVYGLSNITLQYKILSSSTLHFYTRMKYEYIDFLRTRGEILTAPDISSTNIVPEIFLEDGLRVMK
jgi:hypothetical protein